jgi:hypothetical protein
VTGRVTSDLEVQRPGNVLCLHQRQARKLDQFRSHEASGLQEQHKKLHARRANDVMQIAVSSSFSVLFTKGHIAAQEYVPQDLIAVKA